MIKAPGLRLPAALAPLFKTARPRHAFVLTRERLVYVRKEPLRPKGPAPIAGTSPITVFSRPLPPGSLREGPGGVPVVGSPLGRVVQEIAAEAGERIGAASLAVPDDFIHILTVTLEEPEKNPKETEDILLWKVGKMFGDPPPPVRLAWETAGAGTGGTRVIAMVAPEEAASSWESPFTVAGIRIGAVETAALAVSFAGRVIPETGFLLWAEGEVATTLFYKDGNLRFARTKTTADPDEALQEIRIAASFVAEETGAAPAIALDIDGPCAAGPARSPIVERFRAFRAENGGRDPFLLSAEVLLAAEASTGSALKHVAAAARRHEDDPAVLVALGAMSGRS